jgi:hypothetical protein
MSNRRINVLASMMVVCLAGFCGQAFPVNDQLPCSISPRVPCGLDDETQAAVADDDSDDAPDDVLLLYRTSNGAPPFATFPISLGCETMPGSPYLVPSATLESQHVLLRL